MEYAFLEHESPATIYRCFIEAFSDYLVEMQPSYPKFQRMILRNGVDLSFSVGTYDDELVGFILNGKGMWRNTPTLYDSGTALIKEYRGKAHAPAMLDLIQEKMHQKAISTYLLEVIQENTSAFSLYQKQGFFITRELTCLSVDKAHISSPDCSEDILIRYISSPDWRLFTSFWNSYPSWQNSIQAIERMFPHLHALGAYAGTECIGYIIFQQTSGEIFQMATRKEWRQKGIGSLLLHGSANKIHNTIIKILNVDKNDESTLQFLNSCGFTRDIDQYEMLLELP